MGNCATKNIGNKKQPPLLGISVHYLCTIFETECEEYLRARKKDLSSAKIYDIENLQASTGLIRQKGKNVISKVDGKIGASYIDCLEGRDHVGPATQMLSYGWGNKIVDITSSLKEYCAKNKLNTKRTYIWICCLCNNQHRIKEKMDRGENVSVNEFSHVFRKKVLEINHVLSLLVPWDEPIYTTRVWCIFEFYTAIMNNCKIDIIMPQGEKEKLVKAIKKRSGPDNLLKTLAATKIQNANASQKADKDAILELVRSGKGYHSVNEKVNDRIRKWVKETLVEALKESERVLKGGASKDLALLYNNAGLVFDRDGEYANAIQYYKKSLKIQEKDCNKEHQNVATLYNNIGMVYMNRSRHRKSLKYLKKSLAIREKEVGTQHESTAASYNNIGVVYKMKGDYINSLEYHKRSIQIRKELFGESHVSIAASYNNIAEVYIEQKNYNVAVSFLKKSLEIRKRKFGREHPDTATCYHNIAIVYFLINNLGEALKYIKTAVEIREKVLGARHPSTIISKKKYKSIQAKT